jgi:hypothetical protein
MIPERISHLEDILRTAPNIPYGTRRELLTLLAGLKAEVASLADTDAASVEQITGRADAAVTAAIRRESSAEATEGLAASVRDFEASHPRLVEIVDRLAVILSNTGI